MKCSNCKYFFDNHIFTKCIIANETITPKMIVYGCTHYEKIINKIEKNKKNA